ncbi:MAG: carbonic anhydrase [Rhizobacter sp.]
MLDDSVEVPIEGEAAPRRFSFRLRLPKLALRLPDFLRKLPLPRIVLSKKMLVIVAGSVVGVSAAGAAAYALWPAEPEWPRTPVHKPKKAKRPKTAASGASAPLAAASAPASPSSAVSGLAPVAPPASAASGAEDPMDRLQRRLAETLGSNGTLQPGGAGELRLTARKPSDAAPVATRHAAARADASPSPAVESHAGVPVRGAGSRHVDWSYDGPSGPAAWARLQPEFAKCAGGLRQSPIDIRDGIAVQLDPVKFDYHPSAFRVIDNGHTVQVNVAPGNTIEVMGRRFELQQFHFHRPSEEHVAGRQFDMSAHLVHKDAEGRLAVVAVLLERGGAQPVVQSVWNNLPLEKGEELAAPTPIDLQQLLPADRGYYTYMGSLTTPPCSEGVLWMVMKQPVPVSAEQVGIFSRLYPMNARPVQSAAGRMIKESN